MRNAEYRCGMRKIPRIAQYLCKSIESKANRNSNPNPNHCIIALLAIANSYVSVRPFVCLCLSVTLVMYVFNVSAFCTVQ